MIMPRDYDVVFDDLLAKARPDVESMIVREKIINVPKPAEWSACTSYQKGDKIIFEGYEIIVDVEGCLQEII